MLTDSPVVRAAGPRVIFIVGAVVTSSILLWMHALRRGGPVPDLSFVSYALFAFEDYGCTIVGLLILAAAVLLASRIPAHRVLSAAGEHPNIIAALAAVALGAGALFVYRGQPLSMDEYAAYFQGRVFAAGHLTGLFPVPQRDWLIPRGFQNLFLAISPDTGQVASSYWPAYALVLAPFAALGIPWACNPLLSALTALVVHRLAKQMFAATEAAGLALLLTVSSPVLFGLGISYYSMPAQLLANSLYALLLVRPEPRRLLAAGVVGSIALCLNNPLPHLLFAAPWLIWITARRGGLRLLALLALGYLPLCLLLGGGWFELLNHLRHAAPVPGAASGILGQLGPLPSPFSLPTAAVLLARLVGIAKLWVWAVPGMVILAAYAAIRWRRNTLCLLFSASAVTTLIGYLFLPLDRGHGWGDRYFHSAWLALPLLATAAIFRPAIPIPPHGPGTPATGMFEDSQTRLYLTACILLTLVFGVGWRAWVMQDFVTRDLSQLPQYNGTEAQVVIVDPTLTFYGEDLVQNDPWLRGNVIRMITQGRAADRELMARYYPQMHVVSTDRDGWVWSAKPVPHK